MTARSLLPLAVGPAMSASGGRPAAGFRESSVLIARLIADSATVSASLERARALIGEAGLTLTAAEPLGHDDGGRYQCG